MNCLYSVKKAFSEAVVWVKKEKIPYHEILNES